MIYLADVECYGEQEKAGPRILFHAERITIPTDRRVSILCKENNISTALLKVISHNQRISRGHIVSDALFSPLINRSGLFHPKLSLIDNIIFYTRLFHHDKNALLKVLSQRSVQEGWGTEYSLDNPQFRKFIEIELLGLLPFDCYLFEANMPSLTNIQWKHFINRAEKRNAGIIFSTQKSAICRALSDMSLVIRDGKLLSFNNIKKAIEFYER